VSGALIYFAELDAEEKPLPAHLPQSGGCFVPKTAADFTKSSSGF